MESALIALNYESKDVPIEENNILFFHNNEPKRLRVDKMNVLKN